MNKELKDITITVYATQDTVESDSFKNTYDANATYPVANVTELKEALTNGGVVAVTEDIQTNNIEDTAALIPASTAAMESMSMMVQPSPSTAATITAAVLLCRSRRVPSSSTAVPSPASRTATRLTVTTS